jgi:hypothetical protein
MGTDSWQHLAQLIETQRAVKQLTHDQGCPRAVQEHQETRNSAFRKRGAHFENSSNSAFDVTDARSVPMILTVHNVSSSAELKD